VSGTPSEIEAQARELVLRILGVPAPSQGRALLRADVPEWDSLKHMEIVFALEDRFGIQFDESEFPTLDTPVAIAAAVRRHLAP
jgi:acyl carrier protein